LSGLAALAAAALLLSGCVGEEQAVVGVDELHVAVLGDVTPAQQAFLDRMDELSEGSIVVDVEDNWEGAGGDSAEVALAKAVLAGDVDIAWVPVRALTAVGAKGIDALQAPMLIQTHDQQRAVALGVPGEMIRNSLRNTGVTALAMLAGPTLYPVAAGQPLTDVSQWAGKTVAVGAAGASNATESATVEAFGGTPAIADGSVVASIVGGAAQAGVSSLDDLVTGGTTAEGPIITGNVPLWPEMSMIIANSSLLDRLSSRQHGFLDGSVVRAQDASMAEPDLATLTQSACAIGLVFGYASADQLAAYQDATKPVIAALEKDPAEARLLEAIQDAVKQNAGAGIISGGTACLWVAPPAA
jgi:TRAP-type C4-dicarboxylate transport system substrate-binding protein